MNDYIRALTTLKKLLPEDAISEYEILAARMLENLRRESLYGSTRDTDAERFAIIDALNQLAGQYQTRSFTDLCFDGKLPIEDSDQAPVPMTPTEYEELKAALLSAFPSPGSLQQVVAFKLGENLPVIVGGNNYGEIVFNLIVWTEANGRTEDLIVGARQMNPGNFRLRRFEEQYRIRRAK